jgi:Lon protease-like protein
MDVERALQRLPIFPLPGAVLLPHSVVPLHVFEPRYRKMTLDCDAGSKVLALGNIPDEEAAGKKPPRVLPIIGVGQLARVEPLPDGRFNIMVRGAVRARILEELPTSEPYRLVRAQIIAADPGESDSPQARKGAEALRRLIFALCAARPGPETAALAQLAAGATDPGDLADVVAGALLQAPRDRQLALEALHLEERLALATQAAASILAHSPSPTSAPN